MNKDHVVRERVGGLLGIMLISVGLMIAVTACNSDDSPQTSLEATGVVIESDQSSNFDICISDRAAGAEVARFGLVTDMHYADKDVWDVRNYRDGDDKLADAVAAFNADGDIDFVMMMGDYVDSWDGADEAQTLTDLAVIEAVYDDLTADRYYVFGNHDLEDITKAAFIANTGMSSGYYSFDAGDLHVIVLDGCFATDDDEDPYVPGGSQWAAGAMYVPPDERTWLTADLAATSKDTIVFMHYRLDTGSSTYLLTNHAAVVAILAASGKVRQVFAGHKHAATHGQLLGIGYHNLEAMTELAYPNNAYSIVKIYDNGWITVTGTDRQESYSQAAPEC